MSIKTFVFFDLETTGLPSKENPAKITELTFLSVSRHDMERGSIDNLPPYSKLSLLFDPQKDVSPKAAELTGLSNEFLKNQPVFGDKIKCINTFLDLPKPVCLLAHNGDRFDFKIIKREYDTVNAELPNDLACIDTLKAFKEILNNSDESNDSNKVTDTQSESNEQWPDLNVTPDDWKEIDDLIESFSKLKSTPGKKKVAEPQKRSYTLLNIYKRLMKKEPVQCHRAEVDCTMMLECVVATKDKFLPWADRNHKLLSTIKF